MYVYMIVNSETLKHYIGQHKGENLRRYLQQKMSEAQRNLSKRSRLYMSMRKHPRHAWSIHPLLSDLQNREECNYWEKFYIKLFHSQDPNCGYNLAEGGEGAPHGNTHGKANKGRIRSAETCAKLSTAMKLRFSIPENRDQIRQANKGQKKPPRSEEHKRHLSESRMGFRPSAEQLLHQSLAQKGKPKPPRTPEHIKNNADALRGLKRSLEVRKRMSDSHKGKPWTEKQRASFEARPKRPAWNKKPPLTEEQSLKQKENQRTYWRAYRAAWRAAKRAAKTAPAE